MFLTGIEDFSSNLLFANVSSWFFNYSNIGLNFSDGSGVRFADWKDFNNGMEQLIRVKVSGISYNKEESRYDLVCYTEIEDRLMRLLSGYHSVYVSKHGLIYTFPRAVKLGLVNTPPMSDEFNILFSKYCMMG